MGSTGGWQFVTVLRVSVWLSPPQGLRLPPLPSPYTPRVSAQVHHGMGTERATWGPPWPLQRPVGPRGALGLWNEGRPPAKIPCGGKFDLASGLGPGLWLLGGVSTPSAWGGTGGELGGLGPHVGVQILCEGRGGPPGHGSRSAGGHHPPLVPL